MTDNRCSSETAEADIIDVLRSVHSALDRSLGDSDVTHIENDDELREEYPVQWAAQWLAHAIELLDTRTPAITGQGGALARKFCNFLCGEEVCTNEGNWFCPSTPEAVNDWCLELAALASPQAQAGGDAQAEPDRDAIYRAIANNVRSEPDKHFIDRQWLVGINDAVDAILALPSTDREGK